MSQDRADRIAAWATGAGIGLIVLMLTWLIGNRLTGLIWDAPLGPAVAFAGSIGAGTAVAVLAGRRLSRR